MDWKDELVERAKTDPGAPYLQGMVAKMRELHHDDVPESERLRSRLMRAGVRVGQT